MRDLTLDEPAALIYCPCRALLYLPGWADRRRTFPATRWRPIVRLAPAAVDTEEVSLPSPLRRSGHSALTVTVADLEGLTSALRAEPGKTSSASSP